MINSLTDRFGRVHDYLRISLTDKCNFRCRYCNPDGNIGGERSEVLSYEEILRSIDLFAGKLHFKKFRFTGGEPLARKGFFEFLKEVKVLKDRHNFSLGLTTNGSLLNGKVSLLREIGIDILNISLDSLNNEKFQQITGRNDFETVMDSIYKAEKAGFKPLKVNTVVIKGFNDKEISDFIHFIKNRNINIRFIEFMPFGNNNWMREGFISYREIKKIVETDFELIPIISGKNSVAKDFQIKNYNGKVSFISSVSEHFCSTCNRVRLTSNGSFRLCLFSDGDQKINFKKLFRSGLSDIEIINRLQEAMQYKWENHPEANELSCKLENNMLKIGG